MLRQAARAAALLIILSAPTVAAAAPDAKSLHRLELGHLARVYYSLEHVRPVLTNSGDRPVYLSSWHPQAAARLMRLNEETGEWEYGAWAGQCGSVANVTKPIEVLPGGSYWPSVFWQYSTDDWEEPTAFKTAEREARPLAGRYKLSLRYTLKPWVLGGSPGPSFEVRSDEFTLAP